MDTLNLNLLLTGVPAISSSYTKTTIDLDNLQTTRVTKEPREVSDRLDVSVDSNSHSSAVIPLDCVVQVLGCKEEPKRPANTTLQSRGQLQRKGKKKKKTIPRLRTHVL